MVKHEDLKPGWYWAKWYGQEMKCFHVIKGTAGLLVDFESYVLSIEGYEFISIIEGPADGKLNEAMAALEVIEGATAYAESTDPKGNWKALEEANSTAYKVAHAVRSPECLKNHPDWIDPVKEILAEKLGAPKPCKIARTE